MAAILFSNFLIAASLFLVFSVWIRRIFWMAEFRKSNPPLVPLSSLPMDAPKISVIVPARNEEKNIARCLRSLFSQTYTPFEIVVVDDRSSDRTPHLLENFKKLSPCPFKIIRIEKLPTGWTGKNYAMFTGSKAASGEWFLFTDADTTHQVHSLTTAVATAHKDRIDFLTLAPETECHSFWEKVVQPLAVSSLALWFNPHKVNQDKNPAVLANGQFILIKKTVYEVLGGNESVKNQVIEDVEFAKKVRIGGFRVRFLNGTLLYSTRMYHCLSEIQTGWARIFTYLFNKNIAAILHKIFLFVFFSLLPFLILALEITWKFLSPEHYSVYLFLGSFGVCVFIVGVRAKGNQMLKTDPRYALLHALGSLVMIGILIDCLGRIIFKKPSVWRGNSYQ